MNKTRVAFAALLCFYLANNAAAALVINDLEKKNSRLTKLNNFYESALTAIALGDFNEVERICTDATFENLVKDLKL